MSERSLRDRLAEALWREAVWQRGWGARSWDSLVPKAQANYHAQADRFLASLPTVGPILTKEEDIPTRQDDGGGE